MKKKNELNESISKSKWKTITAKRVEEINEYQGIGKTFGKLDKILCHRYFRAKNCKYDTFEERSLVSLLFLKFKSISHWIEIHQVSKCVCVSVQKPLCARQTVKKVPLNKLKIFHFEMRKGRTQKFYINCIVYILLWM